MEIAEEVQTKLKALSLIRGSRRDELTRQVAQDILTYFKQINKSAFTRDSLSALFSGLEFEDRTRQRIAKAILTYMILEGRVKEDIVYLNSYAFRNKPLFSYDYGSYKVLMAKNRNRPRYAQGCFTNCQNSVVREVVRYSKTVYVLTN